MLIETHAHLDYPDFAEDFDAVLARAKDAGITRLVTIGTGLESSRRAIALAEKYEQIFAVVGVHPTNVQDETGNFLPALRELAGHPKVAAIGETGLDYHRLPSEASLQTPPSMAALQAEVTDDISAAVVDGATPMQLFRLVYLPLMAPSLVAVGVYALLLAWNEYLYQFLLLSDKRNMTVPVALAQFLNSDEAPWNYMMATAIVYALPPVAIFFALRRWMLAGLTLGGIRS